MKQTRREFLEFLGYSSIVLGTVSIPANVRASLFSAKNNFNPLKRGISTDELVLASGFEYSMLAQWGDPINQGETFGYNNDYIAFLPDNANNPVSGTLWVNHEYAHPLFVSGYDKKSPKTKEQVIKEQESVGGSVVRVQKTSTGSWELVKDDARNFRVSGRTKIPLSQPILQSKEAVGTLANCAGGVTSWGTILTCEENYQDCYGDRKFGKSIINAAEYDYQWGSFFNYPPEHYGWVVEIDVHKKTSKKLISLGRFAHESATCITAKDGRCVVYSGDDKNDEFIYKFISKTPGSLEEGTLYVADTVNGKWLPLDLEKSPALKLKFKNQTDVMIFAREAGKTLGATPQDRPEDMDINPHTGEILVALTNNASNLNFFGSILKIKEKNNDYLSMEFEVSTFMPGGEKTGFACPDNLAFDPAGNFWFTSDMSGSKMNKFPYTKYGNNGLFVVSQQGKHAGKAVQIASAPMDAELTGPSFTPDGKTLFLSVQHPGEQTESLDNLTSNWPNGGKNIPRPAVVAITGPALEMLTKKLT